MSIVYVLKNPNACITGKELARFLGLKSAKGLGGLVTNGCIPKARATQKHGFENRPNSRKSRCLVPIDNGTVQKAIWLVKDVNQCFFW